jgi:transcriptional activator SPT7
MNGDSGSGLPLSLNPDSLNSMPEFDDQSSGMKFLWSKICSNRRLTNLNDRELRNLLNEVKPNRGKWFSYEKPNQEKLYTAMETVWKTLNDSGVTFFTIFIIFFLMKSIFRKMQSLFNLKYLKRTRQIISEVCAFAFHQQPYISNILTYLVIRNPMDFDTIHTKMKNLQYQSKQQFLDDVELIYSNCFQYNTQPNHYLRKCASAMRKKTEQLSGSIPDIDLNVDDGNKSFLLPDDDDDGDRSVLFSDRGAATPRSNILSTLSANFNNHLEDDNISTNGHNSDQKSTEDAQSQLNSLEMSIQRINQIDLSKGSVDEIMYHLLTRRLTKKMRVFLDHCIQDRVPDLTDFMTNWIHDNQNLTSKQHSIANVNNLDHSELLDSEANYTEGLIIPYSFKSNLENTIPKARNMESDNRVFGVISSSCQKSSQNDSIISNEDSNSNELSTWFDPDLLNIDDIDLLKHFPELNPGPNVSELPIPQFLASGGLADLDNVSKSKFTYENYTKAKPLRHGYANSIFSNLEVLKKVRQLYNQVVMVRQFRAEEALQWLNQNNSEIISAQSEFKAPINISNESPFVDTPSARNLIQRFAITLLSHAGFEAAEPCALEAFTEIAADYITNIGKTLRTYLDNHNQKMSFEEIFMHTLYENGVPNLSCLENHYKYDVDKYGSRLKEVNRKLESALQNILTEPPDDLVTDDGDLNLEQNEESFLTGGLGEITGDDFFGFKELGLGMMTVPTRLITGKKKQAVVQVQEVSVEPELEYPPCPPFSPIASPEKQIGLLKQYFEDKLTDPDPQARLEDEEVPSRSRYKLKVPPIGKAGLSQRKRIAEAAIITDQKRLKRRQESEIRTLKKQKTEEEKMARAQAKLEQKQQREKEKQKAAAAKAEAKKKAAELQAEKKAVKEAGKATPTPASGAQPPESAPLEEIQEESPEPEEEFTSSTSASSVAAISQSEASDSATSSDEDENHSHQPTSKGYNPPLLKIKINLNRINNAISPSVSYDSHSKPKHASSKQHNNYKSSNSRPPKNYNSSNNAQYYDSTTSSSEMSASEETSSTSEDEFPASSQFSGHSSSKNHISASGSRGYKAPPGANSAKNKYPGGQKVLGKRSGHSSSRDNKKRR